MFYVYFYREIWICVSFTNNEKSGRNLVVPILKIECKTFVFEISDRFCFLGSKNALSAHTVGIFIIDFHIIFILERENRRVQVLNKISK